MLILERIVADKIIFDLRKFYCTISKGLWDILGKTWHEMKKLEKWDTFVALIAQPWVKLLISQTFFWFFSLFGQRHQWWKFLFFHGHFWPRLLLLATSAMNTSCESCLWFEILSNLWLPALPNMCSRSLEAISGTPLCKQEFALWEATAGIGLQVRVYSHTGRQALAWKYEYLVTWNGTC